MVSIRLETHYRRNRSTSPQFGSFKRSFAPHAFQIREPAPQKRDWSSVHPRSVSNVSSMDQLRTSSRLASFLSSVTGLSQSPVLKLIPDGVAGQSHQAWEYQPPRLSFLTKYFILFIYYIYDKAMISIIALYILTIRRNKYEVW